MIHSRVKAEAALKRSLRKTLPGHKMTDYNWAATCVLLDVVQPMLKAEAESHRTPSAKEVIVNMPTKCKSKKGKAKKGGGK